MSEVVPLFGRRESVPATEKVLCPACSREIERSHWAAWRSRMSRFAEKFLTVAAIAFFILYGIAAAIVLLSSVYLEPGSLIGLIICGTVLYLMLLLLAFVTRRLRSPPDTIIEHRHVQ